MTLIEEARAARQLPAPAAARSIRIAAGISLRRMAREVGVDHGTLSRWESGQSRPRGEKAARYAELVRDLEKVLSA